MPARNGGQADGAVAPSKWGQRSLGHVIRLEVEDRRAKV